MVAHVADNKDQERAIKLVNPAKKATSFVHTPNKGMDLPLKLRFKFKKLTVNNKESICKGCSSLPKFYS